MSLVKLDKVTLAYGEHIMLRDVDFEMGPSEIVTIVGPNGSGKTSLVKTIIGALMPKSGRVTLRPQLNIGYVPQRLNIDATFPMTVGRFLRLAVDTTKETYEHALEQAGVPQVMGQQLSSLSGGQFQRVLLAKALLGAPDLLILDEATQGLDQLGSASFYRQIEKVRDDTGCAILMISHDLHVVMSASDRVICLNGHVCCAGTPSEVIAMPEYQELFGAEAGGALALYRHHHDHVHNDIDHKNGVDH